MVVFDVNLHDSEGRSRRMFVHREVMLLDLEFVVISSPVGHVANTDLLSAIAQVGGLVHVGLGYMNGALTVDSKLPLGLIDASEPSIFLILVQLVAGTAQAVEEELTTEGGRAHARSIAAREDAWKGIREFVVGNGDFSVEEDLGDGFVLKVQGTTGTHRVIAREWADCLTYETTLGSAESVDLRRAAQCGSLSHGGVVYHHGAVALRASQPLAGLTATRLVVALGDLLNASEAYQQGADFG